MIYLVIKQPIETFIQAVECEMLPVSHFIAIESDIEYDSDSDSDNSLIQGGIFQKPGEDPREDVFAIRDMQNFNYAVEHPEKQIMKHRRCLLDE